MVTLITRNQIGSNRKKGVKCGKHDMARMDKIREEIMIPWRELNKLAKEVVGREFGDCRNLTVQEMRKFILYLQHNRALLMERYRKVVWS